MDISWTLNALIPAAQYGGSLTDKTQEAYDKILWEDTRTKPSWQDLTSEWPNHEDHIVWGTLRSNRNLLLVESDWTQVSDSPVDTTAWATYRQALRDLPQSFNSPEDVVWPNAPA